MDKLMVTIDAESLLRIIALAQEAHTAQGVMLADLKAKIEKGAVPVEPPAPLAGQDTPPAP